MFNEKKKKDSTADFKLQILMLNEKYIHVHVVCYTDVDWLRALANSEAPKVRLYALLGKIHSELVWTVLYLSKLAAEVSD